MILNNPIIVRVTNHICDKTKALSSHISVDEITEVLICDLSPLLSFPLQFFVQLQINMRWLMRPVQ